MACDLMSVSLAKASDLFMTEISAFSANDLRKAYARGRLSPVEVTRDVLARSRAFEPAINAFALLDDKAALLVAKASEKRWRKGRALGPLDGVPVTIKDNLNMSGLPCRRGSAVTSDAPCAQDAPAVARLRESGAVIIGKTTMPEFGWKGAADSPLYGITRNPWDVSKLTGGSSSGAAAAAALNLGCIHIGTDAAGSVRIPAAFTGVFSFMATYGRVPAHPVSTMGFLAHIGPLTRTVRDAACALNAIAQPDWRDMTAMGSAPPDFTKGLNRGVKGLRIGWSPKLGQQIKVDREIAKLTAKAAQVFADLGARVEEVDPGFADPIEVLRTLWSAGAALALAPFDAAQRARMDPRLVAIAVAGEGVSGADYIDALLYQRNALSQTMAKFHATYDLLLTPTLPLPAFEAGRDTPADGSYGDDWTRWTPFTYPFNITQQPAASVPCGLTKAGLPAGLQIVGALGNDLTVLRAARAFERAQPFAMIDAPRGVV
jgi:aspartyl-tRNA(Asn)/glutamyl-tRNA(Gln) amidotransferase subunit A